MLKLILLTFIFFSVHANAKLVVTFKQEPTRQQLNNNTFTETVNLNLLVRAVLAQDDTSGIKAILGYEFFCQGDDNGLVIID